MKSLAKQLELGLTCNLPYAFMFSEEQQAIHEDLAAWDDDFPNNKCSINGQQYTECFNVFSDRLETYKQSFPDGRLVFVGNFDTFKSIKC